MVTRFGSESAFILRITWPLWAFTVISLMPSSPPTCLVKSPLTTNAITCCSRRLRTVTIAELLQLCGLVKSNAAALDGLPDSVQQSVIHANKTRVRFGWCANGGFLEGAGAGRVPFAHAQLDARLRRHLSL